jgi:hypothetical protein
MVSEDRQLRRESGARVRAKVGLCERRDPTDFVGIRDGYWIWQIQASDEKQFGGALGNVRGGILPAAEHRNATVRDELKS